MLITESTAQYRKKNSPFVSCFIKHRFKICIFKDFHAYPHINVYA